MRKLFANLWNDDGGAIISIEMLFIIVILVIGLIAGWAALREGIVYEFASLGNAVALLDDGYYIAPVAATTGNSDGTWVVHGFTTPNNTAITTPIGLQTINNISTVAIPNANLDTPGTVIGGTTPVLPIP
jgi:Flp pilus assembly pilin Flp